MDSRTLRVLEYDKIKALLAERASFGASKERALSIEPFTDLETVMLSLQETSEARTVLRLSKSPPFGGVTDIRDLADRARLGATLSIDELLRIKSTAAGGRRVKKFIAELGEMFPLLGQIAREITAETQIESAVANVITDAGQISDAASPELNRIRRSMRSIESRIRERLEALVKGAASRYLQEPLVTMRNGRFVVPVKTEHRTALAGIVHDQSSSGATLFIEPLASVEANNELKRLELQERDEIERLLAELSAMVGVRRDALHDTVLALCRADFVFAKGRLSADMDGAEPEVGEDFAVDLRAARHPLLKGDVVPIDIRLGTDFDTLVITGPNTGGKTVTLKTLGLCVLMAQSGLHIPASARSRVSIFQDVFCDLGDEQSIEQSLSTFSSHMTSIVRIVNRASMGSLVLLDEIGAGTDPDEGSALAMALLDHLLSVGALTVATTHYSELKSFAYARERVQNASVEFNVETLRPTYKLAIGLPGKSNAFEISKRLGLKDSVIDAARGMLSEEQIEVERLLAHIQAARHHAEEEQRKAHEASVRAAALRAEYNERMAQLKKREQDILQRARQQAQSLLIRVRAECDEALRIARSGEAIEMRTQTREILQKARSVLSRIESEESESKAADRSTAALAAEDVSVGDTVFVKSLEQKAEVLTPPDTTGNVQLQVGVMRITLPLADLSAAESEERTVMRMEIGRMMAAKAQALQSEIKLIGMTADEAIENLGKYLDDALMGGLAQARIVHGKGTGTLRKAVHDHLKANPHIVSFRLGVHGEGGDGVTIARLSE